MRKHQTISGAIAELRDALAKGGRAVLSAPPGAGKTTRVPQEFLSEPWMTGKKIIMLQPRRAAARAAARRIADLLGEEPGRTVGWRVRGDNLVSRDTRIEIVTEGILTRRIQSDPELSCVGMVIFDEFHERGLNTDLGLALCLDAQEGLREDLRVLVMSATLDVDAVSGLLGGCPRVCVEGGLFPVETKWVSAPPRHTVHEAAARAAVSMLAGGHGGVLVFLPGAREINIAADILRQSVPGDVIVAPLYGSMDKAAQDAALLPPPDGRRKVVLATNIAETSLTIESVTCVIDSGYARKMLFDKGGGLNTLQTVRVSKAAAEQRRGRAGRLGPGVCLRLWDEHEHRALADFDTPEILEADLSPLCLELALWGAEAGRLRWMDPPPESSLKAAMELLRMLGAVDDSGCLTKSGRRTASLPVHPRLGTMLVRASGLGLGPLACEIAALVEERDILDGRNSGTDLRERLGILRNRRDEKGFAARLRQVVVIRDQLLSMLGEPRQECDMDRCGLVSAFAYPDRVGRKRAPDSPNYLLSGGRGARFVFEENVGRSEYVVALRLDGAGADARVLLAAPVSEAELSAHFKDDMTTHDITHFDRERGDTSFVRETRLGAVVMRSAPLRDPPPELVTAAILEGVRQRGLSQALPWDDASVSMRERVAFARKLEPDAWPDWSDDAMLQSMEEWLAPFLTGIRSLGALRKLDLKMILSSALGRQLAIRLDREFPERFTVPTGSSIRIDYSGTEPELPVRVQEMFGIRTHPSIRDGRLRLRVRLLSPAMRPIQITSDLPAFWSSSWELVRKDMRGRYPKHHWPDDPANAEATRRAKPRS